MSGVWSQKALPHLASHGDHRCWTALPQMRQRKYLNRFRALEASATDRCAGLFLRLEGPSCRDHSDRARHLAAPSWCRMDIAQSTSLRISDMHQASGITCTRTNAGIVFGVSTCLQSRFAGSVPRPAGLIRQPDVRRLQRRLTTSSHTVGT